MGTVFATRPSTLRSILKRSGLPGNQCFPLKTKREKRKEKASRELAWFISGQATISQMLAAWLIPNGEASKGGGTYMNRPLADSRRLARSHSISIFRLAGPQIGITSHSH